MRKHLESICAWCDRVIPDGHEVFGISAIAKQGVDLEPYRGTMIEITLTSIGKRVPVAVVGSDSPAARDGKDLVFMVCSESCADDLKKVLQQEIHLGGELGG